MKNLIILILTATLLMQCTSSRWTVVDPYAVDDREPPRLVDSSYSVTADNSPTPEFPVFRAALREIHELEYVQRVQVERTLQQYRPRWGFTVLGSIGGLLSFYAGNSDTFISNPSTSQSLALNAAGVILMMMAVTNLKPVGEAIHTGERKLMNQSGTVIRTDTVDAGEPDVPLRAELLVTYQGDSLLTSDHQLQEDPEISVNLAGLLRSRSIQGPDPGVVDVKLRFGEVVQYFTYPVETLMEPVVYINVPATEIRNSPVISSRTSLTEVGNGSEFTYIRDHDLQWYEVQLGGSNVFVERNSGEIRWRAVDNGNTPTIVTIDEVPFGEIDVESFAPVLRQADSLDAGFIITNHTANQIGHRTYLERDFRLVDLYFRNALNLPRERIFEFDADDLHREFATARSEADTLESVFVYIGGFAVSRSEEGEAGIFLVRINEEDEREEVLLDEIARQIAERTRNKLIIFADLEFDHSLSANRPASGNSELLRFSNRIVQIQPNSAIIFSSGVHQSSGVYAGARNENMYHHIFPYFLARGLQGRRTTIHELTRYLESQVDYTSRRLFDRAQEIHTFGNLTIDLSR